MRLPEHSHCENCGDPIADGERFCSESCKDVFEQEESLSKRKEYMMYAGAAGLLIILVTISAAIKLL